MVVQRKVPSTVDLSAFALLTPNLVELVMPCISPSRKVHNSNHKSQITSTNAFYQISPVRL